MADAKRSARMAAVAAAVVSGFVLISAVGVAIAALVGEAKPAWLTAGFEVLIAVASAFGILVGLGRFREAPEMALLCVAGTVALGSLMGNYAVTGQIAGVSLKPLLMGRLGAAVLIGAASAWIVLGRRPERSLRVLGMGMAMGAGAVAIGGGAWMMRATLGGLPGAVRFVLAGVGFLVLLGLAAAAVHLTVRAFEVGLSEPRG